MVAKDMILSVLTLQQTIIKNKKIHLDQNYHFNIYNIAVILKIGQGKRSMCTGHSHWRLSCCLNCHGLREVEAIPLN